MTTPGAPRARVPLLVGGVAASAFVALACVLPRPTGPRPATAMHLTAVRRVAAAAPQADTTGFGRRTAVVERTRTWLRDYKPAWLAIPAGAPIRLWMVDSAGQVVRFSWTDDQIAPRGVPPAIASTVPSDRIAALDMLRVGPGTVGPDSADVVWITLRTGADTAAPSHTSGSMRVTVYGSAAANETHGLQTAETPAHADAGDSVPRRPTIVIDGRRVSPTDTATLRRFDSSSAAMAKSMRTAPAGGAGLTDGWRVAPHDTIVSQDSLRRHKFRVRAEIHDSGRVVEIRRFDSAGRQIGEVERRPGPNAPGGTQDSVLYVINGREVGRGLPWLQMASIDTIVSVSVLKGESALKVYGERGRQGVVEITTTGRPRLPKP